MRFKLLPSVDELVAELQREGVTIDLETAKALWDKATVRALADKGASERTLKLSKELSPEVFTEARDKVMHLSDLLEVLDPTEPGSRDELLGIDAFSRQLALLEDGNGEQIRVYSYGGRPAHSIDEMRSAGHVLDGVGGRVTTGVVLFHELLNRDFRRGGREGTGYFRGNLFYASSTPLWEGLNPQYLTSPVANETRLRRPLVNELVAIRSTVRAGTFKFPEITDQPAESRMRRVAEGADIPLVRLTVSQRDGAVHKFAVGIEITDEAARRTPIDWIRFHVARIGAQNAEDKTQVAVEALANGATNSDITDAGIGGTAGSVESTPLDNFLGLFEEDGYVPTHCIGQRVSTTKLKNATTGTAEQSVFRGPDRIMRGGAQPEEIEHPPIFSRSYAPADKLLYVDSTRALGEATEAGSAKEETDRNIRNGTNLITLQEVVGYHTIDDAARRTLDIEN